MVDVSVLDLALFEVFMIFDYRCPHVFLWNMNLSLGVDLYFVHYVV